MGSLPWDDPDLLRELYHERGLSYAEIAERWPEANANKIRWQFKKHEIETRSVGEAKRLQSNADVCLTFNQGRFIVEWREFGEHIQIPLARIVAIGEYGFDAVIGNDVHHIDENTLDDSPSNLKPLSRREHAQQHPDPPRPTSEEAARYADMNDVERDPETGQFTSKS